MIWRRGHDDGDGALMDASGLVVLMSIGEKMMMMVGKEQLWDGSFYGSMLQESENESYQRGGLLPRRREV